MDRPEYRRRIREAFRSHPVLALLGPRQCGKTTLSRLYVEEERLNGTVHYFDLEDPEDIQALENPKLLLEKLEGLIVLDEIQRLPELFPLLRVLVDKKRPGQQFLILGSASRDLIQQSSETLAGRIAYIELTPFSLTEVDDQEKLWIQGGFPPSYLAEDEATSSFWRKQYVTTYLERDIPQLGIRIPPPALRRYWMMLTHYHGQIYNGSEIAGSLGISDTTARHYLDILSGTFMVRQLLPWIENIKKRQIKRPKIYFRDSGIYHSLLGLDDRESLFLHPKLGASWEGFALEQVIDAHEARPEECFFWGVHSQGELDLLLYKGGKRLGFEFKFNDAPKRTSSMEMAVELLGLDSLQVIYPGKRSYPIGEKITVCPLDTFRQ